MFGFLIDQEIRHKAILETFKKQASQGIDASESVSSFSRLVFEPVIFETKEIEKLKKQRLGELLNKAIDFEKEGNLFYKKQVELEKDPAAIILLKKLASDEFEHEKIIANFGKSLLRI